MRITTNSSFPLYSSLHCVVLSCLSGLVFACVSENVWQSLIGDECCPETAVSLIIFDNIWIFEYLIIFENIRQSLPGDECCSETAGPLFPSPRPPPLSPNQNSSLVTTHSVIPHVKTYLGKEFYIVGISSIPVIGSCLFSGAATLSHLLTPCL